MTALMQNWFARLAFVALLLAVTTLVYYPGLDGPFLLDDSENILQNPAVAIHDVDLQKLGQAVGGGESGPFKRPLASLSFALNHYYAGGFDSSAAFKAVNLAIHLINVCLVYLLCRVLLATPALREKLNDRQRFLATMSAVSLWALHPIQLTNVLYTVQRMNSLSAAFVLTGLIVYVYGRLRVDSDKPYGLPMMCAAILLGGLMGSAAKENAVLLPLYAATVEYVLFRSGTLLRPTRIALSVLYTLTLLVPLLLVTALVVHDPGLLTASYAERSFTLTERILTETRILWYYLGLILVPRTGELSLFHDDITLSATLFNPATTLLATGALMASLILALTQARRLPGLAFAILWFLAGHSLESGIFGLELAYEHRNYLPSVGVFFALGLGISQLAGMGSWLSLRALLFIGPAALAAVAFSTGILATIWANPLTLAEHMARHHPNSPRTLSYAAYVHLDRGNIAESIRYLERGIEAVPDEVGFHIDRQIQLTSVMTAGPARNPPSRLPSSLTHDAAEAIHTLLQTRPISVYGIVALENLFHCLTIPPPSCQALQQRALTWYTAAAENQRTSAVYRALILSNTARLYASNGNIHKALGYIERAVTLEPRRLYYRLLKTDFLAQAGRVTEAKEMLMGITHSSDRPNPQLQQHKEFYDRLMTLVATTRE